MSDTFQILERRFGGSRPGLKLIGIEEAAIPVTMLRADVLAQERKELPVTEGFALRFVERGVNMTADIAAYLGLDEGHVIEAAAAQIRDGNLRRRTRGELGLTVLGLEVARTLAATQAVERPLPVAFDRLTWKLADYSERALIEKKQAEERGMVVLPADRNARIGTDDVSAAEFNALLKADRLQVLRVHKVTTRKHRYLPALLLVFADTERKEIELALCLDDDLSDAHAIALNRVGAVERLGIKVGSPPERPALDEDLEQLRAADGEAVEAASEPESSADGPTPAPVPDPFATGADGIAPVRSVSVFEHPDLLNRALRTARVRLMIVAPWIKNAVVNTDFLGRLEQRLRAGVAVTIAHGYGDDDRGSDEAALRKLRNLTQRYSNLSFVRLQNTHAKILIFDDVWVSTSFNWLSFRGDADRTYRMEEGTLVSIQSRVQKQYDHYLEMLEAQRVD